ncbi:hypothetical protein ACLI09_05780 [Flavobacterium sp. RHBU_24]|uniref:hypothetical protein n=1 Tax=Flavobacterium sp. RHBU_24 TaxID=3391185 RepID=UPI00398557F0
MKTPVKPGVWLLKAKIATILPQAYTMKNHLVEPPGIELRTKPLQYKGISIINFQIATILPQIDDFNNV